MPALSVVAEEEESLLKIRGMDKKINRCVWGPCNSTLISGGEDGVLRLWDTEVRRRACGWSRLWYTVGFRPQTVRYIVRFISHTVRYRRRCAGFV